MECVRCRYQDWAKDAVRARYGVCKHYIDTHIPDKIDKAYTTWLRRGWYKSREEKSARYAWRLDFEAVGRLRPKPPPPLGAGEEVLEAEEGFAKLTEVAGPTSVAILSLEPHPPPPSLSSRNHPSLTAPRQLAPLPPDHPSSAHRPEDPPSHTPSDEDLLYGRLSPFIENIDTEGQLEPCEGGEEVIQQVAYSDSDTQHAPN